ncbi:MAG: TolC family protein [Acidobacteriota bacterium]
MTRSVPSNTNASRQGPAFNLDAGRRIDSVGFRIPAVATMIAAAFLSSAATACARWNDLRIARPGRVGPGTSTSPGQPWVAPPGIVSKPPADISPASLPPSYVPGSPITLAEIVDIALANNPSTRIAWLQARAAEADLGSSRADYLPELDLDAEVGHARSGGGGRTVVTQMTYGPSLSLSYLLFDFGGRSARSEQARQTLIAADFEHNAIIQNVVLAAQRAFYQYVEGKALLAAQEATLKELQTNLDSANARHEAGVATIADVLQARTALSQARLNFETIDGSLRTIEGQLATAMGLSPVTRFDVGTLPLEVPSTEVNEAIEELLARAQENRPDLASARALAARASQRVTEVRAQGLPKISVATSMGKTYFGSGSSTSPFSTSLLFGWPIFTGFRNTYDIRAAERGAEAAAEQVHAVRDQVNLQVWSSYYSLQTAAQRMTTARDLLASATQSAEVAAGRYREGVGSILDLLTAEAALQSARAQEVQSRTDWFLSVAQLAHDTGQLYGSASPAPGSTTGLKGLQ